VANNSVVGSASQVVHAAVGPANLQLRARGPDGFDERLVARVEHLAGVEQAAPLLEQTATVLSPRSGRQITVDVIGANLSLATLNGLAHTLPVAALAPGGISLSKVSAEALGIRAGAASRGQRVSLKLRGSTGTLNVAAVLGPEAFGALSRARVAVMPLARLQQLAGLPGRVSRVLVQASPTHLAGVRRELLSLAGGKIAVAPADQDLTLLRQALGPSGQATTLFAAISALLGFLFAFNALLLTVPDRRQAIADLRVDGTKRSAIFQMIVFQGLCLGIVASAVGLIGGYTLSRSVFHQSPGYLSHAFTLGTNTVIGARPLVLSLASGVLAIGLASIMPLLDLRGTRALDSVYVEEGAPGEGLGDETRQRLFAAAVGLLLLASVLFVLLPSAAIVACVLLALATVLAVPLAVAVILRVAEAAAERYERLTLLSAALTSLRATTIRSLALAATGAVALFGSVALGGSRDDLLRGIADYTSHYVAGAGIWLVNPEDNQAINDFTPGSVQAGIARLPGVGNVQSFQGSFLDIGRRRVWIIAWPAGVPARLLTGQLISGSPDVAAARLGVGGWITASAQLAGEQHRQVGDTLTVPTPTGGAPFKIAATTTNFGWSPGAIVMSAADYQRHWASTAPSALGVELQPGASSSAVRSEITTALGPTTGLDVLSAEARAAKINASAREGLSQLGDISTLLILAAILAMIAALGSSVWQRRMSLAGLRVEGTKPSRLRRVLLIEATLMLGAGCLTGTAAGIYGQAVIDGYLKSVTGFPVASFATGLRPLEIFAVVVAVVLAVTAVPGWFASRISPTFALDE